MIKRILFACAALIWSVFFSGCGRQTSDPSKEISEYLPIMLNDHFTLSSIWHDNNYPYAKTDLSESDLMVIYRAISGFRPFGVNPPWGDEVIFGSQYILCSVSEVHETRIIFTGHSQWGNFASVSINNEFYQWFEVDSDAVDEIIRILNQENL